MKHVEPRLLKPEEKVILELTKCVRDEKRVVLEHSSCFLPMSENLFIISV